jgi:hypothetical protein
MTDEVYVAEPARKYDDPDTYHEHRECRALRRAEGVRVRPREPTVDTLEECAVCAGADLTGAARVLAQADPDEYPPERGRSR